MSILIISDNTFNDMQSINKHIDKNKSLYTIVNRALTYFFETDRSYCKQVKEFSYNNTQDIEKVFFFKTSNDTTTKEKDIEDIIKNIPQETIISPICSIYDELSKKKQSKKDNDTKKILNRMGLFDRQNERDIKIKNKYKKLFKKNNNKKKSKN
jgi:hypothetical protein